MVLCSLPQEILSTFTFCTMSYDVRKYGDSLFQYQIIPNAVRNIPTRNYSNIMVCEEFSSIEKYPYWIQCYMQALLQDTLQDLYCFIRQYGTEYMTFTCYNHFARLYFALIGEMEISLTEYIESISMLFKSSQPLSQKTMELLLDNTFFPEVFINQEYQLLEIIEMKHLWPQKDWIKKLKCKIIHNTPEKLYPYMQRYIVGSLPVQICELVEDIIHELSPNHLRVVSHMDSNICFVLIRKNYNMLLCPDIWKQPRDFQQEILCAIGRTLEPELIKKLLVLILQTDVENIAEDMYRVLGNPLLPLLYDAICFARLIGEDQLRNWTPILLKDPNLLLDRILSLPESNWRQELFLQIDMNGEGFAQCVKKERWISLYQEFFKKETSICRQVDIAIQFFPAVFCTTYHFDDDFVRDVVGTVYREAKNNTMNSGVWSRFQHILPQVEDYQAWDRCLRIRRALDEKGYIVALIESVT
ncbi:hypothetical protein ADH66_15455 [Acutalibacter muris]|nr:hypothetical protein ADH66_15455 [Acutalibacter muris]